MANSGSRPPMARIPSASRASPRITPSAGRTSYASFNPDRKDHPMKRLLPFVAACGLVSVALADPAPPVMTEAQRIYLPSPNPYLMLEDLALDGEHLMVVARGDNRRGLLAFHRDSDGVWRYTQT